MSSNTRMVAQPPTSDWLGIDDLAEALRCSTRLIYEFKNDRVLRAGTDFYTVGNGTIRGKHIYNLESCRAALLKRTAETAKKKFKAQAIKPSETYNEGHLAELVEREERR